MFQNVFFLWSSFAFVKDTFNLDIFILICTNTKAYNVLQLKLKSGLHRESTERNSHNYIEKKIL